MVFFPLFRYLRIWGMKDGGVRTLLKKIEGKNVNWVEQNWVINILIYWLQNWNIMENETYICKRILKCFFSSNKIETLNWNYFNCQKQIIENFKYKEFCKNSKSPDKLQQSQPCLLFFRQCLSRVSATWFSYDPCAFKD